MSFRHKLFNRIAVVALAAVTALPCVFAGGQAPKQLFIEIVQGNDTVNNVKQRVATEPMVVVYDENHNPVPGATVVFLLPSNGAGATFPGGAKTLTVTTNSQGQATATGLQANSLAGPFKVSVTASINGVSSAASIGMANILAAAAAGGAAAGGSGVLISVLTVGAVGGVLGGLGAAGTFSSSSPH